MYNRADFRRLLAKLDASLIAPESGPLSCLLHEAPYSHGLVNVSFTQSDYHFPHAAEACNIASVIGSIRRILSLPRSNVACEEMAQVLLLRLDVLREYISAAIKRSQRVRYLETSAELCIRRWAGFLKHPSDYVFACTCFTDLDAVFDPPAVEIDCEFLAAWDRFNPAERDKRKRDLAHRMVSVRMPEVEKIEVFFEASAIHLQQLVEASSNALQEVPPHPPKTIQATFVT